MALEASDMSDGKILENTQRYQNSNGQIQFKTTLPSGRGLESEWFQAEQQKRAMVAWLDVVKTEATNDSDLARMEAREAAMKERNEALARTASDALLQAAETPESVSTEGVLTAKIEHSPVSAPTAVFSSASGAVLPRTQPISSPDDFVAVGLQAAEADYDHWNQVALDAVGRVQAASKNIEKWSFLKKAMEGSNVQDSSGNSVSSSSVRDLEPKPVTRRRKRTVAKSTDFQEPDVSNFAVRGS